VTTTTVVYRNTTIRYCTSCNNSIDRARQPTDVKSSSRTWPRGQQFWPRLRSIRPRPHPMLASFSRRLSVWSRCQSSKSRHLRYVLLWQEIVTCFIIFY